MVFYMKEENQPLYQLLLSNISAFLEVKGEWSLSRLTSLLNNNGLIDAQLATEKYRLVKDAIAADTKTKFVGYSSRTKIIEDNIHVLPKLLGKRRQYTCITETL